MEKEKVLMYPTLCASRFSPLLAEFEFDQIDPPGGVGSTIYGLWPDLTLAYANSAWSHFAAQNGGEPAISTDWSLGRCIMEAIAEPLRPFFFENYGRCLRESRPWEHVYDCSSADVYREFYMTVFPLGKAEGLLVIHSRRIETKHDRVPHPPLEGRYRDT